jgi:hypothetical protein
MQAAEIFSALILDFSVSRLSVELSHPLQAGDLVVINTDQKAILAPFSSNARGQRLAQVAAVPGSRSGECTAIQVRRAVSAAALFSITT